VLGLIWSAKYDISDDSFAKWGGLAIFTPALFGWVIKQTRKFWQSRVFWMSLGTLLVIHVAAWIAILRSLAHWRLAWWVLTLVEVPLIGIARDRTIDRFGQKHRSIGTEPRL